MYACARAPFLYSACFFFFFFLFVFSCRSFRFVSFHSNIKLGLSTKASHTQPPNNSRLSPTHRRAGKGKPSFAYIASDSFTTGSRLAHRRPLSQSQRSPAHKRRVPSSATAPRGTPPKGREVSGISRSEITGGCSFSKCVFRSVFLSHRLEIGVLGLVRDVLFINGIL